LNLLAVAQRVQHLLVLLALPLHWQDEQKVKDSKNRHHREEGKQASSPPGRGLKEE
jgi:hypothetical protein